MSTIYKYLLMVYEVYSDNKELIYSDISYYKNELINNFNKNFNSLEITDITNIKIKTKILNDEGKDLLVTCIAYDLYADAFSIFKNKYIKE